MKIVFRLCLILSFLLLASCAGVQERRLAATSLPFDAGVQMFTPVPLPAQPTAAALLPTHAASPTATLAPDPVIEAVLSYAGALQEGKYEDAASLLSGYSLMVEQMTRGQAASALKLRMARTQWSSFQAGTAQPAGDKTILVSVSYLQAVEDADTGEVAQSPVEELWPLRLENGRWLVNYGGLVDFRTLDVRAQTTGGLTVKPRQLTRYADRIALKLLVQNQTNEPIVLGQPNEIMATFLFGSEKIEAEKARFIFDRLRSYPDVVIEVKGQFDSYPDGIIIRQWKNYNVAPWFTFSFNQ